MREGGREAGREGRGGEGTLTEEEIAGLQGMSSLMGTETSPVCPSVLIPFSFHSTAQVIAEGLKEEEIAGLREMFESMDTDGSGTITMEELRAGLKKFGASLSEDEIERIMEEVREREEQKEGENGREGESKDRGAGSMREEGSKMAMSQLGLGSDLRECPPHIGSKRVLVSCQVDAIACK